jgi:hypothetical protein
MGDVETCKLGQILTFAPRMHGAKSQREEGVLCNRPFWDWMYMFELQLQARIDLQV